MGIYLFRTDLLYEGLRKEARQDSAHDFACLSGKCTRILERNISVPTIAIVCLIIKQNRREALLLKSIASLRSLPSFGFVHFPDRHSTLARTFFRL